MIHIQRVFIKQGANLIDASVDLCDYNSKSYSLNYTSATDAIFIGSVFPFNHKHIELVTANTDATIASITTWDDNVFNAVVDIIDETSVSGVSLGKSGYIRFTQNDDIAWTREQDSFEVPGLETTVIYDMYWSKITFSNDFSAEIKFIGHKFSNDDDLFTYYPDLNNTSLMSQYESGKTNWDTQHFMAAQSIISELTKRSIVFSPDQILTPEIFTEASCHKVAALIYGSFGDGFRDDKTQAIKDYSECMNKSYYNVDRNGDAKLNLGERVVSTRFFYR